MGKTSKKSAGLLMYRKAAAGTEVFLVHPGGPYWAKRNEGSWTIPKGEYAGEEAALAAAKREFREETGFRASEPFLQLGSVKQKSGKIVSAWAFEGDGDPAALVSNTCEIEWPPRSGRHMQIPEVDRGDWYSLSAARSFIREEQVVLLDRLAQLLNLG